MIINQLKISLKKTSIAVFILSWTNFGWASDSNELFLLPLEELLNIKIETATKTVEKSSLSPAVISVISAKDINNYGYNTVAEALSHVTGFVDNFDLAMHNFGVRGINSGARSGSRTIKFMLDGQAIAFRATSQNFIGSELIPMDMIERIEVVRGPVSALYGANAFLGVVNIVTKSGEKYAKNGGEIALQASAIENAGDGYNLAATYGGKTSHWDYSVGASGGSNDRAGIQLPTGSPAYDRVESLQSTSDDSRPLSLYARSKYTFDDKSGIKLNGFYQRLNVESPFSDINPLQLNQTTEIALENAFIRSDYDLDLTDKTHLHLFSAFSLGATLDDDRIEVGAERFFLTRRFGYSSLDFGAEIFFKFRENDSVLLGFDLKKDEHKIETFTRLDRISGEASLLNPDRDETLKNTGLYLQYLMQINPGWRFISGLRSDDDSVIGQQSSARFGVVGQFDNNVVLKMLTGSAFQAPSAELLYRTAVQAGDIIGNPNLSAQKANTFEVSVAKPIGDLSHMTATYFKTKVDDLVVFESDSSNLFANNSAASTTNGIELELRLFWSGIDSYFNYTYQQTRRDRNPLSLFVLEHRPTGEIHPEQSANFGLSYYWQKTQTKLSLNNRWVGKREASTLNVLYINQFYQLDSYMDSTLTIATDQFSLLKNKKATLRFQVKDLFDNNYVNPGFGGIEFASLGRQFLLSFEQRF